MTSLWAALGALLTALIPFIIDWLGDRSEVETKAEREARKRRENEIVITTQIVKAVQDEDAIGINTAFVLQSELSMALPETGDRHHHAHCGRINGAACLGDAGGVHSDGGLVAQAPSVRAAPATTVSGVTGDDIRRVMAAAKASENLGEKDE